MVGEEHFVPYERWSKSCSAFLCSCAGTSVFCSPLPREGAVMYFNEYKLGVATLSPTHDRHGERGHARS